uniref:Isopropylmalate dehydrogenase-like domain-containing protein n=1 Tax=Timema tahoe TaxID=61484 RepID=A0A7R9IKE7_9NEOP|nr:unnamed protein product [Timema tahoe]
MDVKRVYIRRDSRERYEEYLDKRSCNEILEIMRHHVTRTTSRITVAEHNAIIEDETYYDISVQEQAATLSDYDIQHKSPLQRRVVTIIKNKYLQAPIPKAQYGGRHTVTMLPGAGIGPELMNYVKEVFRYGGVPVDFEVVQIDPKSETNDDLDYAITTIRRNGVAIKGNIETGSLTRGVTSRNVALRNELDLYVNVLKCQTYPGVPSRQKNIDIVIIRQNTEGEYAMLEHESVHGVVESMKVVTQENSERVARFTFEFARKNGRKKYSVFEPGARNTGTSIAGKNIANPIAMLNASVDMLEHLGHRYHAEIIKNAIDKTINEDRIHTPVNRANNSSNDAFNILKYFKNLASSSLSVWNMLANAPSQATSQLHEWTHSVCRLIHHTVEWLALAAQSQEREKRGTK